MQFAAEHVSCVASSCVSCVASERALIGVPDRRLDPLKRHDPHRHEMGSELASELQYPNELEHSIDY